MVWGTLEIGVIGNTSGFGPEIRSSNLLSSTFDDYFQKWISTDGVEIILYRRDRKRLIHLDKWNSSRFSNNHLKNKFGYSFSYFY